MAHDLRLKKNCKLFISGPSNSGKTTFIQSLLKNAENFLSQPTSKTIYYYTQWQEKFDEMAGDGVVDIFIEDNENIIEELKNLSSDGPIFVVFDDMINTKNMAQIANLYSTVGRHSNISMAFLTQKLFVNDPFFRQISQNSDYFVIFKNPRNSTEIRSLSSQMTPGSMELQHIYKYATTEPFSYLFINVTQECIPELKYLGNLFKSVGVVEVYVTPPSTRYYAKKNKI